MYDRNVILRYLDNPTRIAFWTIDEMAALFVPSMFGCIFQFVGIGVLMSVGTYLGLKYLKQSFGGGVLRHAMYWYLPGMHKVMRIRILSYVREYVG